MLSEIQTELDEFVSLAKECLGTGLRGIWLYGSYARGDGTQNSDIDLLILVDLPESGIRKIENRIYDGAFDLELKYGKTISPIIKNRNFFEYWADTLPFYRNIKMEGVKVA